MRQFTGTFNLDNGNIGLTPSITSADGISVDPIGPEPKPDDGDQFGIWSIVGFVLLGLFIMFIIIGIIHCCCQTKADGEDSEELDPDEIEERNLNKKEFQDIKLNRSDSTSTHSSLSDAYYEAKKNKKPLTDINLILPQNSFDQTSQVEGMSKIDINSDRHPFSVITESSKAYTCDEFGKHKFKRK